MSDQDHSPRRVETTHCVEIAASPLAHRAGQGGVEDVVRGVIYAAHSHNLSVEPESGGGVALAFHRHDCRSHDWNSKMGDAVMVYGSKVALLALLADAPQLAKLVKKRMVMCGEVAPVRQHQSGVAYIRDRRLDRARRERKQGKSDRARKLEEAVSADEVLRLPVQKPMIVRVSSGDAMGEGYVNTYGFPTESRPLYL
jgi:hypothetical protein